MAAVEDPIELRFTNYKFTLHHKNTLMFSVEDVSVGVRSCSVNSAVVIRYSCSNAAIGAERHKENIHQETAEVDLMRRIIETTTSAAALLEHRLSCK